MTRFIKLFLASLLLTFGFYACGGATGSKTLPDADLDGVPDISDCAPADASLGGPDIANDGIDQDCTGVDKKVLKTTSQSDSNNDGVIDSETITEYSLTGKTTKIDYGFGIYYYTYDANDNLLVEQIDDDSDGSIDRVTVNEYNANGKKIKQTIDFENDGIINKEFQWTYNADGLEINRRSFDAGVLQRDVTSTYDASGNKIEELDNEIAGTNTDYKYLRTYNLLDQEVHYEAYKSVGGAPFVKTFQQDISYDAAGNLISIYEDQSPFGPSPSDRIRNFFYNADGEDIGANQDTGADGTIDFVSTLEVTQNPDGSTRYALKKDEGNDGTIDSEEIRVEDANNFLLATEDNDLVTGDYYRSAYEYNEFGLYQKLTSRDFNPVTLVEEVYVTYYEYEYNE